MRNPLQEQLLKAGLAKKSKLDQVARDQAKQRHAKSTPAASAEQAEAERVRLEKVERDRALSATERETLIQHLSLLRLPTPKAEFVIAPAAWLRLKTAIEATLTTFHTDFPNLPGIGLERLRLQLEPRLPTPVFV